MWNNQSKNMGNSVRLVVYFHPDQPRKVQTYYAFQSEEKKGTAIQGLTRRLLQGKLRGMYQTAIFYADGAEVEKWINGIKI